MNDRYKARQTTVDPTITERLFIDRSGANAIPKNVNLDGQISLYRVKDARKAFRRRYASRKNIDGIFE